MICGSQKTGILEQRAVLMLFLKNPYGVTNALTVIRAAHAFEYHGRFTERFSGIMPRPEGTLWYSGIPVQTEPHGPLATDECAYRRRVNGINFILLNEQDGCTIFRNGEPLMHFPRGIRIETDQEGNLKSAIGMVPRPVEGIITYEGKSHPCSVGANQVFLTALNFVQKTHFLNN